ncbi:MAG: diacylglycerol/lipid kinase family protein [Anaerolineae bacterium]
MCQTMDSPDRSAYSVPMKALLIYNPVAGQRDTHSDLAEVIAMLRSKGWDVTLRETRGAGDATTYAREAVAGHYDMAVAVGGDGTLGEVAAGLAHSECTLGVLPVGTGNVWAHMLGLPLWTPWYRTALMDAAQVLVEGETHHIDLGKVGERYFVLWTGVGFDAAVAHGVEPHREVRRSLGNLTYLVTSIALGLGLRGTRMTVIIDGKAFRQRILLVIIANVQLYGGSIRVAPHAQLDDGMLDVYVFKGETLLDLLRHLVNIVAGRHQNDAKVNAYRASRVEIRGERSLPLHLDGEPAGHTPVVIEVAPRALHVVTPRGVSTSLFEGGAAAKDLSVAERIVDRLRFERARLRTEGERWAADWDHLWHGPSREPEEESPEAEQDRR